MSTAALAVAYVVVVVVVIQWVLVVKERRRPAFVAHSLALAVVVLVWLDKEQPLPAIVSGAWLAISVAWYVLGGPAGLLARRRWPTRRPGASGEAGE